VPATYCQAKTPGASPKNSSLLFLFPIANLSALRQFPRRRLGYFNTNPPVSTLVFPIQLGAIVVRRAAPRSVSIFHPCQLGPSAGTCGLAWAIQPPTTSFDSGVHHSTEDNSRTQRSKLRLL
jgi:hypothetical protein